MKRKRRSFSLKNHSLRIVCLSTIPLVLLLIISNIIVFFTTWFSTNNQIKQSATTIQSAIEVHLKDYIRAYLQSKVETGVDILSPSSSDIDNFSFEERLEILRSIPVGISGYFYAIDSHGVMIFHPDENLVGRDLAHLSPMKEQMAARHGYLEYYWRNTDEDQPYKKALYMEYLPESDWIVTATSYSRDFTSMVDMDAIRSVVMHGTVGETGYSWIMDKEGNFVVHPYLKNPDDAEQFITKEEYTEIVDRIFERKDGLLRYQWPRNAGENTRGKIMYLKFLPDFDWVVGTSIERSELIGPTLTFILVDIGGDYYRCFAAFLFYYQFQ